MDHLRAVHLLGGFTRVVQLALNAVLLHRVLSREHSGEGRDAQHRVRVGVARREARETLTGLLARRRGLTVAGNRVVLGIGQQRGAVTIRPACAEGCRHARRAVFDLEALGTQQVDIPLLRPVLAPGWLCELPNDRVPFGELLKVIIDPGLCGQLGCRVQFRHVSSSVSIRKYFVEQARRECAVAVAVLASAGADADCSGVQARLE